MKKMISKITSALAVSTLLLSGLALPASAAGAWNGTVAGGGGSTSSYDGGVIFTYIGIPGSYNDDSAAINYIRSNANRYFSPRTNIGLPSPHEIGLAVGQACGTARSAAGVRAKTVLVQVALNSSDYSRGRYGTYQSNKANFRSNYNSNVGTINSKFAILKDGGAAIKAKHWASIQGDYPNLRVSCTVARESDLTLATPPSYDGSVEITVADTTSINEPHSYTTVASSQILANGAAFNQQATKITEFGKVYDEYLKISSPTKEQYTKFVADAKAAIAKDKANPDLSATVSLSAGNKKTLANGGVLNVSQTEVRQPLVAGNSKKFKVSYKGCTRELGNSAKPTYKTDAEATSYIEAVKRNYGCKSYSRETPTSDTWTVAASATVPQEVGFWQTLIVHCNSAGFKDIVAKLGGNASEISQTSSGSYTGVVTTNKFNGREDASTSMGGILGTSSGSYADSGTKGFYDKECPFECVPDGGTRSVDFPTGAKASGESGLDFTMFRDNTDRTIEVQRWVPKDQPGVKYSGSKALTTSITLDPLSTPGTKATATQGGKFTLTDSSGGEVFGKDQVKNQTNWNSGTFRGLNSAVLSGEFTKFNAKASWASEDGLPVRLNFKWEYAPVVETNFSGDNIGFGVNGDKTVSAPGPVGTPIEGKCYAGFETVPNGIDTEGLFQENTGTDTTNNLDGTMLDSAKGRSDISITFVRATTR